MKTIVPLISALATLTVSSALAQTTYTDPLGDNYGGPEVDISSVTVFNDASNITFKVNMNPAADLGVNHYANYEIGIQVGNGAGGQTAINGTYGTGNPAAGNPYGNAVGISTGENFFIGSFLDSPGNYSGGAQLYSYSAVAGWTQIGGTAPITEIYTGTPSTAFTFSLASLGLTVGSSFNFDVYTTFGSPQGAYDALDNNGLGSGTAPYSGGTYDSATAPGSTFATTIYTIQAAPEPGTCALLGLGALGMMGSLRRRHAK
jgi:hypothetical protein